MLMDEARVNEIHEIVSNSVFGYRIAKDSINFFRFLRKNQISLEEMEEFVVALHRKMKERQEIEKRNREIYDKKCPECGTSMGLSSGDKGDSHWTCPKCRFGIYNTESINAVIQKMANEYYNPRNKRKKTGVRGSKRRRK